MTATRARSDTPRALLARLEPFVVAPRWRFERLDLVPLGVPIPESNRFDVLSPRSADFIDRLISLDRQTFGPEGMPMPERLFIDGSALPGVIAGLGLRARDLPNGGHAGFEVNAKPDDLVPLAMYIAVPARPPHVWYGHNLASANSLLPELNLRGLGGVTKALGLTVMRCTEQLGATQWASKALNVHTRFGHLELLSAWTPAHSDPATLTYRTRLTIHTFDDVLDGRRRVTPDHVELRVDPRDTSTLRAIEVRIERGEGLAIVGPPERQADGSVRVPVGMLAGADVSLQPAT